MATRYEGRDDCALVIDGEEVIIEHRDSPQPEVRFEQSRLSAVHFEKATRFVSGILTVAIDGNELIVPTGLSVGRDPWTIVFKHKSNGTFLGAHLWLKQLVEQNAAR